MTFEAWCKEVHGIDNMTFTLRHPKSQEELVEEYNKYNRRKT